MTLADEATSVLPECSGMFNFKVLTITLFSMSCILLLIPHPVVSLTFSYPWNLCDCVWCSTLLDHFGVQHWV